MFALWRYEKRLKVVEERQDEFARQMRALELEWDETYDKIRTLFARIAKRAERSSKAGDDATTESSLDPTVSSSEQPSGLSSRAQLIQQQILARRRRINGGG